MTSPEQSDVGAPRERLPAWVKWGSVAVVFAAANFGYGVVCEQKCGELCKEQGFPQASWTSGSGFWMRLVSASSGNHGTCLCANGQPVSALRPATFKEVRLTFGK